MEYFLWCVLIVVAGGLGFLLCGMLASERIAKLERRILELQKYREMAELGWECDRIALAVQTRFR